MRYRIRLPESGGGWEMDVTDWLYLVEDGVILNRSQFRRFGIKFAELVATIRPAGSEPAGGPRQIGKHLIYMENPIPVNSKSTGACARSGHFRSRRAFIAMAAGGLLAATRGTGGDVVVTSPAAADAAGEFVLVDGVRLRFQRMGEGPPVVLIHGASGNLNDMTFRLAPALAEPIRCSPSTGPATA